MVAAFHINRMFLTSWLIDAFHAFEGVKFIRRPTQSLTSAQAADLTSAEAQEDIDDAMHEVWQAPPQPAFRHTHTHTHTQQNVTTTTTTTITTTTTTTASTT